MGTSETVQRENFIAIIVYIKKRESAQIITTMSYFIIAETKYPVPKDKGRKLFQFVESYFSTQLDGSKTG